MSWSILDTGRASAEENMLLDAKLLEELEPDSKPTLHLYDWQGDCATYGYFTNPDLYLQRDQVQRHRLNLARRPTGGGIVFHLTDFAFSILVPASHPAYSINTMDNYAFVNAMVIQTVIAYRRTQDAPKLLPIEPKPLDASSQHFCMAKPTKYDVILDGRKVGGGAQRRTKAGFLHQGTISLCALSDSYLKDVLQPGTQVLEAMRENSYHLVDTLSQLQHARSQIKDLLIQTINRG